MANDPYIRSFTCFDGTRRLLTAALPEVALALKQAVAGGAAGPLLVFDNYFAFYASKKVPAEILTRLSEALVRAGSQPSVQQALAGKAGVYPAVFNAAGYTPAFPARACCTEG